MSDSAKKALQDFLSTSQDHGCKQGDQPKKEGINLRSKCQPAQESKFSTIVAAGEEEYNVTTFSGQRMTKVKTFSAQKKQHAPYQTSQGSKRESLNNVLREHDTKSSKHSQHDQCQSLDASIPVIDVSRISNELSKQVSVSPHNQSIDQGEAPDVTEKKWNHLLQHVVHSGKAEAETQITAEN